MNIGSRASTIAVCLGLIGSLAFIAPSISWAEGGAEDTRYSWHSSATMERAGLPRVFSLSPETSRTRGGLLRETRLVRFLDGLPVAPVSIGTRPRLPYDSDPALGLVLVYHFNL